MDILDGLDFDNPPHIRAAEEQAGHPGSAKTDPGKAPEGVSGPNVRVEHIEVEAVVKGVLMRIVFGEATHPAMIGDWLRSIDPGMKVREDFPQRGSFGKRETKTATVVMVNFESRGGAQYWSLACKSGEDEVMVKVGKKHADGFLDLIKGKLSEAMAEKLLAGVTGQKSAMAILGDEGFDVTYVSLDDGSCFFEAVV